MKKIFPPLILIIVFSCGSSIAQPGTIDPDFNIPGYSIYHYPSNSLYLPSTVIQSDGKIVVTGTMYYNSFVSIVMIRYDVNGRIDYSFGNNGRVQIDSLTDEYHCNTAVQSDDKILIAGTRSNGSHDFMLIRLNANGSIDNAFGSNGIVTTDLGADDIAYAMALQPDGKIVLAGRRYDAIGLTDDASVVRYNDDGTPDNSFGNNGIVITSVYGVGSELYAVTIQPDGKIVAVGTVDLLGLIIRYNADGTLDGSFDAGGVHLAGSPYYPTFFAVAIHNDGRIMACGVAEYGINAILSYVEPDGSGENDITFAPEISSLFTSIIELPDSEVVIAGIRTGGTNPYELSFVRFDSNLNYLNDSPIYFPLKEEHFSVTYLYSFFPVSSTLQPDGKLLLSAGLDSDDPDAFLTVRLNDNGTFDKSFGTGVPATDSIGVGNDEVNAVALQQDGKIIVAGSSFNGTDDDFSLMRYDGDGYVDSSFGNSGRVNTPIGFGYDDCYSEAIQSDGKIITAGQSNNGQNEDFALVRYNDDGTPDNSFGTGGMVTTDFQNSYDGIQEVLLQSDGKIIAAGNTFGFTLDFALARYNTDGSLDNTFGTNGKVTTIIGGYDDFATAAALQPDGKIVVTGSTSDGYEDAIAVIRYNSDGSPDNSFGTGGMVITDFSGQNEEMSAIAIQPDGKILVGGYTLNVMTHADILLARYKANGSLDSSFGINGFYDDLLSNGDNLINGIALDNLDEIIVAGKVTVNSVSKFMIGRLNSNGTPDSTFGSNGYTFTSIGKNASGNDVKIQPDGKMVVGGITFNGLNDDFAVARYLTDFPTSNSTASESEQHSISVYPNPFSGGGITVQYEFMKPELVTIYLLDETGNRICNFIDQQSQMPGIHHGHLNLPEKLSAGIYCVVVQTNERCQAVKVMKF